MSRENCGNYSLRERERLLILDLLMEGQCLDLPSGNFYALKLFIS